MRIYFLLITLLLNYFVQAQKKPKVVFIIADGIPADVIERVKPPALHKIVQNGEYHRAYVGGIKDTYKETPTISAPGYNDLLTGVWGYKHNVWDNNNQHPNYNYASIFRLAKSQKNPITTAIFSTWTDNRTVLLGAGLEQTGKLPIDYVFDGYENDTIRFPHDPDSKYINQIDELVISKADSVIRLNAPDLSWIYLEYTDDIGHRNGTSTEFDEGIKLLDTRLEKIAEAINYRETNFNENWLLLITTDHGRDSVTGHNHGGQTERERTTWIAINKKVTNTYWVKGNPAIVDIFPSIANFLNLELLGATKTELDGSPFIGEISITDATMKASGDSLHIGWTAFRPDENVRVSIAFTDLAKEGKKDKYQYLGTVSSGTGKARFPVPGLATRGFYKVILEGKFNTLNARFIKK